MKRKLLLLFTAISLAFLSSCRVDSELPRLKGIDAVYGGNGAVVFSVAESDLTAEGIVFGDSVNIRLNRKCIFTDVPFYSNHFSSQDQMYLTPHGDGAELTLVLPADKDLCASSDFTHTKRARIELNEKEKYIHTERAYSFYASVISQIDTGGFDAPSYDEKNTMHYVLTQFTSVSGLLNAEGKTENIEGRAHSQLLPVTAGARYYMGFRDASMETVGAFYDETGAWVAPLTSADVVKYDYKSTNGIPGTWRFEDEHTSADYRYMLLYSFVAPKKAAYVSLNLTATNDFAYRQYLATTPVYALSNSGNVMWKDSEEIYQKNRNKKLCVIGQSNIMIDRLLRKTNPGEPVEYQYVCGFQEYLVPWFQTVDSFGYSGKGYMKNGSTGMYDYIIDGQLDLSGYDMFLITAGFNALTLSNLGEYTDTDPSTYFGAMNALLDYIDAQYADAEKPEIYLSCIYYNKKSELRTRVFEETQKLAIARECHFLDVVAGTGIGADDLNERTYDGIHANQYGNSILGLYYRKEIVGF